MYCTGAKAYELYRRLCEADVGIPACKLPSTSPANAACGMDALVEAHDEEEIRVALESGAKIIGVNNRNLKDFSVDTGHAQQLRQYAPEDTLFVVESGMQTPDDIQAARDANADAVLIGETLMRAADKAAMLQYLKGANT